MSAPISEGGPSGVLAGFDPQNGFVVRNDSNEPAYLETGANTYETIKPQDLSQVHTELRNYTLRNQPNINADIYLNIQISPGDASVEVLPGTLRGNFYVETNFT